MFTKSGKIIPHLSTRGAKGVPAERKAPGGGMLPPHIRRFIEWRKKQTGFGKAVYDVIVDAIKLMGKGNSENLRVYEECYPAECKLLQDYYENNERYQKLVKELELKHITI